MNLIIIRGLPGSGKTTFAHLISDYVFEADDFFTDEAGNYNFNGEKIKEAHMQCQQKVVGAMLLKVPTIVVSNTAVKRWEMNVYYGYAQAFGYKVTEITMSGKRYESIHLVPQEVIERMERTWEK